MGYDYTAELTEVTLPFILANRSQWLSHCSQFLKFDCPIFFFITAQRLSAAAAGSSASERIAPSRRHISLLLYRKPEVRRTPARGQSNHQGEPLAAPAPHPLQPTPPIKREPVFLSESIFIDRTSPEDTAA
jgi:hypothetical protein